MKLKDLKEWLDSLPNEFMEFDVVNSEEGELNDVDRMNELAGINESKHDFTYRLDRPIIAFSIDESTKEALLFSKIKQSDEQ